jgi:predicted signal transduction protein with EAL and GGDEF domain
LSDALLSRACRDARGWPANVGLSFNISPTLLRGGDLAARVLAIVDGAGLDIKRLKLEITENAIVRDLEAARASLGALREAGVRIALDDFGTGATSLFHLRSFKFDTIKIDRSFISHMATELESAAIVRALLGLGKGLGVEIVAEGVESPSEQLLLQQAGCHEAQGFLYARAMPADETRRFLQADTPSSEESAA